MKLGIRVAASTIARILFAVTWDQHHANWTPRGERSFVPRRPTSWRPTSSAWIR